MEDLMYHVVGNTYYTQLALQQIQPKQYKIKIKTLYNEFEWEVEDYNSPEVQEVLNQPYIVEVKIEKIKRLERKR